MILKTRFTDKRTPGLLKLCLFTLVVLSSPEKRPWEKNPSYQIHLLSNLIGFRISQAYSVHQS